MNLRPHQFPLSGMGICSSQRCPQLSFNDKVSHSLRRRRRAAGVLGSGWLAAIISCGVLALFSPSAEAPQTAQAGNAVGPLAGHQRNVALAAQPGSHGYTLCVWDDKGTEAFGQENIRARLLSDTGPVGGLIDVCVAAGEQKRPAPVAVAGGFLVFWEDRRNVSNPSGPRDIFATLVKDSRAVPSSGFAVSQEEDDESDVEAVANDAGVLAVWERKGAQSGIFGVLADAQGRISSPEPFRVSNVAGEEPAVAGGQGSYLVAWESYTGGRRILTRLVTRVAGGNSVVLGPEIEAGPFLKGEAEPDVIWTGTHYLVTWSYLGSDRDPAIIVGRRFHGDGTAADPMALTLASGVLAKETAMARSENCIYLLTVPAPPAARVLQARQICYGAVVEITSPWTLSAGDGELPQDPVVDGGWTAWEDRRFRNTQAREDIYARRFQPSAYTVSAHLVSSTAETPKPGIAVDIGGDWLGWWHQGGKVAEGIILKSARQGQFWVPGTLPPGYGERNGGFGVALTSSGIAAVVYRDVVGDLAVHRLYPNLWGNVPSLLRVPLTQRVPNPIQIATADAIRIAIDPTNAYPALAAVLSQDYGGGPRCRLVSLPFYGEGTVIDMGQLPEAPADARWELRLAAQPGAAAVLARWYSPSEGSGRIYLRRAALTNGIHPSSAWMDAGTLSREASPDVLLTSDQSAVVIRPVSQGSGWEAASIQESGQAPPPWLVSTNYFAEIRAAPRPGGFLLFQRCVHPTLHVVELDSSARPSKAWQWDAGLPLTPFSVHGEGEKVTLLSGSTYTHWRPLRTESIFMDPATRSLHIRFSGPAGLSGWVRSAPSLHDMLDHYPRLPISLETADNTFSGTGHFRWQINPGEPRRFFRLESSQLRHTNF